MRLNVERTASLTLRPYQREALESIKMKLGAMTNRQLVKLPTGMGKTVIFASLPDYLKLRKRMLIVVHREELARQAVEKLKKWNSGRSVGIEMGELSSNNEDLVVVGVQTIGKRDSPRLLQFDPHDFDAVVCDESHHSTSRSYQNIFNHFRVVQDVGRLSLGVTATVARADRKGLGDVYQEIVYDMSLLDGINQGWLVDLRGIRISTQTSLDRVHSVAGEFNLGELTGAVNTFRRNDLAARSWLDHAQSRQTLAFAVDIQHAKDLATAFKLHGVAAEAIWGSDSERAEKAKAHRAGKLKVLVNVGIYTEGYDDPSIGCILLARPTKSEGLFTQMIGRGTRLPQGINNLHDARKAGIPISKEDCIVLDMVDVTSKHSLITLPTLFGVNKDMDLRGKKISVVMKEIEDLAKTKLFADTSQVTDINKLKSYAEGVDLFRITFSPEIVQFSEFKWHKTGLEAYSLRLPGEDVLRMKKDLLGRWRVTGTILTRHIDFADTTFSIAIRNADHMVRAWGGNAALTLVKREAGQGKFNAEELDMFRIKFSPEVIQFSEFQWFKTGEEYYLLALQNGDSLRITHDLLDQWRVTGTVLSLPIDVTHASFSEAIKAADDLVRQGGTRDTTSLMRDAKWHADPPTPVQITICKKFRIPIPEGATKGDVSKRLNKMFTDMKLSDEKRRVARMALLGR